MENGGALAAIQSMKTHADTVSVQVMCDALNSKCLKIQALKQSTDSVCPCFLPVLTETSLHAVEKPGFTYA